MNTEQMRIEFEAWWEQFKSEHEEWKWADKEALLFQAWQAAINSQAKSVPKVTIEHCKQVDAVVHSDGNIFFTNIDKLNKAVALVAHQQADKVRELEAKIRDLPRYSFLSPKEGGVRRYEDSSGAWIERYEVINLLESSKL